MKWKLRLALIASTLIIVNILVMKVYTAEDEENRYLYAGQEEQGFDASTDLTFNFSKYVLDVVVDASGLLQTKYPLTTEHWRHYNPALQYYNGKLYYFGRLSRLARESRKGEKYWIKSNKFFASVLEYNKHSKSFHLKNSTFVDPFENTRRPISNSRSQDKDLASFGDCEVERDYDTSGHGYQDPRLFIFNGKLYLLFNARSQVYDGSLCEPGILRSQYLSEVQTKGSDFVFLPPLRLQVKGRNAVEKNWSPFVSGAKLYFSYKLYPEHVVLECRSVVNGDWQCAEQYRTDSTGAFKEVTMRYDELKDKKNLKQFEAHGGSILLPLKSNGQSGKEKYIGVFHYSHGNTWHVRNYFNCVYYVEAKPPFKILEVVSDPIPLFLDPGKALNTLMEHAPPFYKKRYPSGKVAFASDATILSSEQFEGAADHASSRNFLFLCYGVADAVARIRVFSL